MFWVAQSGLGLLRNPSTDIFLCICQIAIGSFHSISSRMNLFEARHFILAYYLELLIFGPMWGPIVALKDIAGQKIQQIRILRIKIHNLTHEIGGEKLFQKSC